MNDLNSIKIVGNGTITSGEYDNVSIIGDAITIDSFKCNYLKVVGTCNIKKDVVTEKIKILGEIISESEIITKNTLEVLGKLISLKDYKVNKMKILGQATFKENLYFEEAEIVGELEVSKSCEGNIFNSRGKLKIDGLLSAENININPIGITFINEIGGSIIKIKKKRIFSLKNIKVISESIEGDYIELQNTECRVVRGCDIKVLGGCKIDRIEYTGSLTIDKKSVVGEKVCLKN